MKRKLWTQKTFSLIVICLLAVSIFSVDLSLVKAQPLVCSASGGGGVSGGVYFISGSGTGYASGTNYVSLNVNYFDDVQFSVTPPSGYAFANWFDGTNIFYDNPHTISVITAGVDMVAYFNAVPTPTATPIPSPTPTPLPYTATATGSSGTYTITNLNTGASSTAATSSSLQFTAGQTLSFSVIPPTGYTLDHWSDGVNTYSANPQNLVLSNSITLTASFALVTNNYTYQLYGPYYEDGSVLHGIVNVKMYQTDNSTYSFILNGTSGFADSKVIYLSKPAQYFTWNISSGDLNYSRVYDVMDSTHLDTIHLTVPDINDPYNIYQFTISDFFGMSDPFLEASINVNGQTWVTERRALTVATPSFTLSQWHSYALTFRCNQGVYSQSFSAESTLTTNLLVLPGAFPTNTLTSVTTNAYRINGTSIQASYLDPSLNTTWINFVISHIDNNNIIIDFNQTVPSSSYTLTWNYADASFDYTVEMKASYAGTICTYDYPCGTVLSSSNPFGVFTNLFGSLPLYWQGGFMVYANFDLTQLVAIALIMLALCVGSYFSMTLGCGLSWAVGLFLAWAGWWQASVGPLILGGITVGLIIWVEAKKKEREF